MAKSAAATAYVILFLLAAACTAVPTASSFQILPDFLRCFMAVGQILDCGVKHVPSHLALQVTLTDECCKAIIGIEENCHIVNMTSSFGPAILNLTSTICGPVSSFPYPRKVFKLKY
ncbi:hypothetical protein KSP39_PZI023053 [Platanthera zijinensis]|uniref:Prolamin-like domain-containing protein n=1 Tax=Platanthera zijinensis TaxID=2320716 RepID=A0AAP0FV21_9ASPA